MWSRDNGLSFAETAVDDKSNEIAAIPLLLESLNIKGCAITIDAAKCQKNIVDKIINKNGNYVLALKKNHPKFYKKVSEYCQSEAINPENRLKDYFDEDHGRSVSRRYFSVISLILRKSKTKNPREKEKPLLC